VELWADCVKARGTSRASAAGYDIILIETVGVGQDEIEVVKAADTVLVVCVPGQGDGVQTLKAGIMEIADLFVVNKADCDGAETLVADIRAMQTLAADASADKAPVLATCAVSGQGVEQLVEALLTYTRRADRIEAREAARVQEEILTLVERDIARRVRQRCARNGTLDDAVRRVRNGEVDPYSAAQEIVRNVALEDRSADGREQ
jgi:LAO/AO transport system kinase